jgi:hypothetical protein
VHPPYAKSRGQQAIALWELAARGPMDPWQRDGVDIVCGVADDGLWACAEYLELVARQNGKGCIDEARVLAGHLLWGERLILWSAQLRDTALEGFLRLEDLLRNLGRGVGKNLILIDDGAGHTIPIKVNYTNGKEAFLRLDTRQRVKVITRSEQSGRGLSADLIVIDEAMFFTNEEQEALDFAQSARPNPQMIYTSTPPKDGDSGEVLYRLRDRAEAMARGERADEDDHGDEAEYDKRDALGARIWGVEGDLDHLDRIDLDDPRNVEAANPAYPHRIKPHTVRRERRKMTARGYARERLCIWPVRRLVAGGRIDEQKWSDLQDAASERDKTLGCSLGVEIAAEMDYASIVLYGVRADGLGHVALVDRKAGTAWLAPRLKELKRDLDPVAIGMTVVTFGVIKNELTKAGMIRPEDRPREKKDADAKPHRGDLLVTNGPDSAAACGQIIVAVTEESFRVKPHPEYPEVLDAAATGAKTRRAGDALKWVRTDSADELEISPVGAMSSARFAYLARVDALATEKPPPPDPLVERDARLSETADLSEVGF